MKIKKNAQQKNFIVNKDYYTEDELLTMSIQKIIFCYSEFFDIRYLTNIQQVRYITNIRQVEGCCFRIFADMCKEVKVVYDKNSGCYETVVITDDDQLIHVCL